MFIDRLINQIKEKNVPIICGLDPNINLIPTDFLYSYKDRASTTAKAKIVFDYNQLIIDQINDLIPAIKPQIAYYEALGIAGMQCLQKTIDYAKSKELLVVLDAKRNDIGTTATAYAQAYLTRQHSSDFSVDALTIIPFMGLDSMEPFFSMSRKYDKGIFVCVKTSNPGSNDIQNIKAENGQYIYEIIANMVMRYAKSEKNIGYSGYSNIGAVVGASHIKEACILRKKMSHAFFLVPGLGTQGGNMSMIKNFLNPDKQGAIFNFSRFLMYPPVHSKSVSKSIRNNAQILIQSIQNIINK